MSRRVLVTGAAGTIGSMLRQGLPAMGWTLRLLDTAPLGTAPLDIGAPGAAVSDEELVAADIRDAGSLDAAMAGVDAVVHLAGIATEAPFRDLLAANVGTYEIFDAARRHLSTWLSPGDMVRLTHACLTAPDLTYAVVYGISANTRRWWDLEPGRALGFKPVDDAEAYAAEVLATAPPADPGAPEERYLGGEFAGCGYDAPP